MKIAIAQIWQETHTFCPNLTRLTEFKQGGLFTGEEILIHSVSGNNDLVPCLCYKLAKDTGLDSCDIAAWISSSLKQYWADNYLSR